MKDSQGDPSRRGKGAGDGASTPLRGLSNAQIRAGAFALALLVCMLLPWYTENYEGGSNNRSAISVLTWVEAAVFVVVGAVVYLLHARSQRRGFHLPGGDGWAVTIAGAWVLFLLVFRLFDRYEVAQGSVGVQWGLFVTMGVAVGLALAGQAIRAEHRPEPPNPAADDPTWEMPTRRQRARRQPVDTQAVTRALDRPEWEGEPPPPLERAKPVRPKPPPPPPPEGKLF